MDVNSLPGWSDDTVAQALPGLKRACQKFQGLADGSMVGAGAVARPVAAWRIACQALNDIPESDAGLRAALEKAFVPYRVTASLPGADDTDKGTFTGYYEAELNGSLVQTGNYQVPIYAPPRNLITANLQEFSRQAHAAPGRRSRTCWSAVSMRRRPSGLVRGSSSRSIQPRRNRSAGMLCAGSADVLVWADDPVAVHILHIQGSGRVTLPDGQVMHIGFAAHNGRPFRGLGSILTGSRRGAARQGLDDRHPRLAQGSSRPGGRLYEPQRPLHFFPAGEPKRKRRRSPIGRAWRVVTVRRPFPRGGSALHPLGAPVWLDVPDPDDVELQRLVVAAEDRHSDQPGRCAATISGAMGKTLSSRPPA